MAPKTVSKSMGNDTDLPMAAYAFRRLWFDDRAAAESLVATPMPLYGLFWM